MSEKSVLRRRITPSVPFTFNVENADGSKLTHSVKLAYDLNSLALLEEASGCNLLRDMGLLFNNPSVSLVTAMVWAGLQINHAEDFGGKEGLELVRNFLTLPQLKDALTQCIEAFLSQLPKEKADAIKASAEGKQEDPLAQGATAQQ
jgi:hypothetical protein